MLAVIGITAVAMAIAQDATTVPAAGLPAAEPIQLFGVDKAAQPAGTGGIGQATAEVGAALNAPAAPAPVVLAAPVIEAPAAPVVEPVVAPAVVPAEPVAPAVAPAVVPAEPVAPAAVSVPAPAVDAPAVETPAAVVSEPVAPGIAAPAAPAPGGVSVLMNQQEVMRKAYKAHLRDTLAAGDKALKESRYEEAIRIYEEALNLVTRIGNRPEDRAEKNAALAGLAESQYRHANYLMTRGAYKEALEVARKAVARGHKDAPKLAGKIQKLLENPPPPPTPKVPARWGEKEYKQDVEKVSELLRSGRQYIATGELDKARKVIETVLSKDPENTEAIRLLEKIGSRRFDIATAEAEASKQNMMADVRKKFSATDYAAAAEERNIWTEWEKQKKVAPVIENERQAVIRKMQGIKIPEIEFRQANIHDVINFLQAAGVEHDGSTEKDVEKGVNIILNLAAGQPATPAATKAPADPFAPAAVDAAAGGGAEDVPPITFSARYISLYEALKIVTEVAGLKMRVSGSVVMIVRRNAPDDNIINRMYDVLPSVGDRIEAVQPALRGPANRSGANEFIAMGAEGTGTARGDWKEFFAALGVSWPEGSSIKYVPAIGKIVVANTAENLTVFENVLSALNLVPFQIEIESRFVEVGQSDLQSIGFEWNLTDDWEVAHKKDDSSQRISVSKNNMTTGLRYADTVTAVGEDALADDSVMTIQSVLTNPELELVLHLLQQKDNTDLLSAPKVTTQSGLEATLKVVTEYIYPTSFSLENAQNSGNNTGDNVVQNNIPVAVPENFETREVGVILSVLPEVSPEGQMINLTMSPEVVSDPVWYNYGGTYPDGEGGTVEVNMPQPFFHTRSIQTSISIYNGATVVMGGLITEKRTTTDDKIPFLGDIPLIGRLFQSRVDDSEKRNLLIFVTARLVDPAGRPVQKSQNQLPDLVSSTGAGSPTP